MKRIERRSIPTRDIKPPAKLYVVDKSATKRRLSPAKKFEKRNQKPETELTLRNFRIKREKIDHDTDETVADSDFDWPALSVPGFCPSIVKTEKDDDKDRDYECPQDSLLDIKTEFNGRRTRNMKRKMAEIGWKSEDELEERNKESENVFWPEIDYFNNPPAGTLGAKKGAERGLPKYEFNSVHQYQIPELCAKISPGCCIPWSQDPASPPPNLQLNILSVVGSVSLGRTLNLEKIAQQGMDLNYDPDSGFTPLVMRLREPKSTALIFKSGKMVITGTKSEAECFIAAKSFAEQIRKVLKYKNRISSNTLQIQNISATCNLGFRIRVHLMGRDKLLSNQTSYHPEVFSGVSIPLSSPKAKVTIFRTGSVLITGAKSEAEVYRALEIVYPQAKIYAN